MLLAVLNLYTICSRAQVRMPNQGEASLSLVIGGATITCSSGGAPVYWIADYQLNDVGVTLPDFRHIVYKPEAILQVPAKIAMFWLGHECGHAYNRTANELEADCWSAKTGVEQGWFDVSDFQQLSTLMQTNKGDATHPPGPVRMNNIAHCMGITKTDRDNSDSDTDVSDNVSTGSCEGKYQRCLGNVRTVDQCIQDEFPARCIKTCVNSFGFSYDECSTRRCLPTSSNVSGWKRSCARITDDERDKCKEKRDDCTGS